MKKKKSSLVVVGNCIFYLFIIAVIFLAGINIIGSKEGKHPSILGYSSYYILTGSMEPTINPGSLVIVKDGTDQDINVGDVITFTARNSNIVTTHRVEQVINNGKEFITKGDANNVVDPISVERNQVIGKVIFHIPYLGKVTQFVQKNLVLILVVILALFGLSFLVRKEK